jgi:hypothetical protein
LSPFAYLLRGIVINEMTSAHWDAPFSPGVTLGVVRGADILHGRIDMLPARNANMPALRH